MKKYSAKLLDEVPPDYYDQGIKHNLLQKIWHSWKWHTLQSLLQGLSGEILDLGCAGGMLTNKIQSEIPSSRLVGVDLYNAAIAYAKKKHSHIRFLCADAHKLPFHSQSFDVVVSIETLEHLHEPAKAVKEIYRVLKTGGIFIVGQDTDSLAFRTIWWFWTKLKGKVWREVHINCMSPKELSFLLVKEGFQIEKRVFSHLGLEVFFKARKAK